MPCAYRSAPLHEALLCLQCSAALRDLPSFPTRRSSDLSGGGTKISSPAASMGYKVAVIEKDRLGGTCLNRGDRKSTRLNSSHSQISYAVFCLKKKTSCACTSKSCS